MGIRYYAYPVHADLIEVAKVSPRSFLSDDPLTDAWGPADERPPMLYLDKCWRYLQSLLGGDDTSPKRPAFQLVEGRVIDTSEGWIAHTAVLDPNQVTEVSKDLATVTAEEVRSMLSASGGPGRPDSFDEDFDYVTQYLQEALAFTTGLSERGAGLAYLIG